MSTTEQTEHSTRGSYVHAGEEYNRDTSYIEDRIVADSAATAYLDPDHQLWPVMPGAYRLVAARPCPGAGSRAGSVRPHPLYSAA